MPTEAEFDEALETFSQYVEEIGDEVVEERGESPGMRIGPPDAEGMWCAHGSNHYVISGVPKNKFFTIVYPRLIVPNIARKLEDETIDELLSGYTEEEIEEQLSQMDTVEPIDEEDLEKDIDITTSRELLAAHEWLGSLDSELLQEIRYHLKERLMSPEVGFQLIPESDNVVYGFIVTKKIFPYGDGLSLQEFYDRVQAVVSVGVAGNNFLGITFSITDEELATPAPPTGQ